MINLGTETPWSLSYSFDTMVDFCIWVLEVDGLHVPPFNRHPDGNGILRAKGMEPESWRAWMTKIVLLLDQRLNWLVEEPEAKVADTLDSFARMTSISSVERPTSDFSNSEPTLRASIDQQMAWQNRYYWDAVRAVQQFCGEFVPLQVSQSEPADLWDGEPAVKELLKELWQRYTFVSQEHDSECRRREAERVEISTQQLWDDLQPYHSRLADLSLYQVVYPEPVEYLVPPVSAILSVSTGASDNDYAFRQRALQAAKDLARSNAS